MPQRSRIPSLPTAVRRWVAGAAVSVALTGLSACGVAPPVPPPAIASAQLPAPAAINPAEIAAVLVAGDSEQPVFDNAINYMYDALGNVGEAGSLVRKLSVRYAVDNEPATVDRIVARIAATKAPANGECLVFMTSHGVFGEGLYVELSDAVLTPIALDQALQRGCGNAPTVVIVSSCFSGQFAGPPVARPNRIVLTASAPDRPSFGCGADFTYTYFDDCLLGSLDGAATWKEIFRRTNGCVAQREVQSGAQPSRPEARFGSLVTELPSPWPRAEGTSRTAILFQPSGESFDPDQVPLSDADRKVMQDDLDYYAQAAKPKALALAPVGFATVAARDGLGRRTADDVARIALQRCEWLTGGGCILYARDDVTVAPLPSGLPPFHPQILAREGAVTADSVPFIREDQRGLVAAYMKLPDPKALALSPSHDEISVGTGATKTIADQEALARCQFVMENCILYAEGNRVVLGW